MSEKLPVKIDNRGGNIVLHAIQRLLPSLEEMDIAIGVFEIGSLLLLEGLWQDLNQIRILIGMRLLNSQNERLRGGLQRTNGEKIQAY